MKRATIQKYSLGGWASEKLGVNKKSLFGKTLGYMGDAATMMADNTLSTVGANNVINDNSYQTNLGKKVSNITGKVTNATGVIAGSVLLPGIGGQVMSGVQGGVGNMVGDPVAEQELARQNKLNTLQGKTQQLNNNIQSGMYAKGGVKLTKRPNAEVEKGEVLRYPNSKIVGISNNAPTHAEGGVQMNLPNGTQILGKNRIPGSTTTYKEAGQQLVNQISKANRSITKNASTIDLATAKMNLENAQRQFDALLYMQESQKSNKQSGNKYPNGGTTNSDSDFEKFKQNVQSDQYDKEYAELNYYKSQLDNKLRERDKSFDSYIKNAPHSVKDSMKYAEDLYSSGKTSARLKSDEIQNILGDKYNRYLELKTKHAKQFNIDPGDDYGYRNSLMIKPAKHSNTIYDNTGNKRGEYSADIVYDPSNTQNPYSYKFYNTETFGKGGIKKYQGGTDGVYPSLGLQQGKPYIGPTIYNNPTTSGLTRVGLYPINNSVTSNYTPSQNTTQSTTQPMQAKPVKKIYKKTYTPKNNNNNGGNTINNTGILTSPLTHKGSIQNKYRNDSGLKQSSISPNERQQLAQSWNQTSDSGSWFGRNQGNLVNGLATAGSLAPIAYNLIKGSQKTQNLKASDYYNPYEGQVNDLMASRRYNIEPELTSNRSTQRIMDRNLRNAGLSQAALVGGYASSAAARRASDAQSWATKNNFDNQYKGEEAQSKANLGQQKANTKLGIKQINMQSKANKENMIAIAMGQIGNFSQQQQLMYGQRQADKQKLDLLPGLVPHYDYTAENKYSFKKAKGGIIKNNKRK